MSIQGKIICLFVGLAVMPLLLIAWLAHRQTLLAVDAAVEADLVSEVVVAGAVMEREAAVAEASLRAFAQLIPSGAAEAALERARASGPALLPAPFHYLALERDGVAVTSAGEVTTGPACRDDGYAVAVVVEVPLEEEGVALVGAYRPNPTGMLHDGSELWAYDATGELLAATTCAVSPWAPMAGSVPNAGIVRRKGQGGASETVAAAGVPARGWTMVMTGSNLFGAPIAGPFRDYWLLIMVFAGAALLAFSAFLRPMIGSLTDLTRAVERVAAGDFRPWVPTPRGDEVGRLTVAFHDMTDRLRDMMAQVDRSSRLAVLGKLSAYLAHEIRNPLSSVKMNLQRLQRWRRAGEIPERYGSAIEISLREVDRLQAAVSNILQLSPREARPREVVALHTLVAEVGQLLGRDFERRRVELRLALHAEGDRVLGDPGQLKGVVINLMLNAIDAQPDGGELLVRSVLRPRGSQGRGPRVELRFRDRGPGISSELRDRIFEPFFTTKESGSGVGLAVASQTVRDHGGEIYVAEPTHPTEGAELVVSLPLAAVVPQGDLGAVEPGVSPWMEHPVEATTVPSRGSDAPIR
jgi:signal transduction histidine kinase